MAKILTVVIPSYNMANYLSRCMDSVVLAEVLSDIEAIIVNDGSKDNTEAVAQDYVNRFPDTVRLINKENGGHGSAVNAGIDAATGFYICVLDADDWFDRDAFVSLIKILTKRFAENKTTDVVITNYVYEKAYDNTRWVMKYTNALPQGVEFTGEKINRLGTYQYLGMHTLTYRTQMLKDCGMRLQEHTYYVDNEYAYIPIPYSKTYIYYDLDLYRYFIGRPDQSITLESCINKIDHHERVLKRLILYYDLERSGFPDYKVEYMLKELHKLIMIYVCFLTISKDKKLIESKFEFYAWLKDNSPYVYKKACSQITTRIMKNKSRAANFVTAFIYGLLRRMLKFQ